MTQNEGARVLEVPFPLPEWFRESHTMRLVQRRDDATSPADRLVTGDLLHFKPLEGSRNVVLNDVVQRGFLGKVVEHVRRQPRR